MINALLIDDEPINIINLQRLLELHCPTVRVAGTADNADEGATAIRQLRPDLVFLDIQMPGKNGFDMLQSIPHPDFALIFVTAFDQYGIQAVKFAAMDYLLKPVDADELIAAVAKATAAIVHKKQQQQLQYLVEILRQGQQKDEHRIALPSLKETRFVYTRNIIRCESSNSYTHFYLNDGEKITVAVSIYEYEELLDSYGFVRCHQSHLVNKKFVKSIVKESGGYLLMQDGTQIPVSRTRKEELKKKLM
ncbi:LytTR family DNA-binding domain-containing protein [Chitinophaga sp. 212800010-3]|uniref:LytR/AlgR family response regulator transcription factor n=1 Tax=unclassified Chitinophaga TaxID=2619133 RepID=UPI002DEAF4CD|nr:Two-component system response regulator [Chitinophaga sp. 212800010-3]